MINTIQDHIFIAFKIYGIRCYQFRHWNFGHAFFSIFQDIMIPHFFLCARLRTLFRLVSLFNSWYNTSTQNRVSFLCSRTTFPHMARYFFAVCTADCRYKNISRSFTDLVPLSGYSKMRKKRRVMASLVPSCVRSFA